jgi:uncharacterized integral membrane protein
MKSYFKAIGLIFILLFLVTFGINNNQLIQLKYYFNYQTTEFPLYLLAYACATIGIFIGMLIGLVNRFHQRKKMKMLTKLNNELKAKAEKDKKEEEKPTDQKPAADDAAADDAKEKPPEDKTSKDAEIKSENPKDKKAEEKAGDTQPITGIKSGYTKNSDAADKN